jgi:hypothetical protein
MYGAMFDSLMETRSIYKSGVIYTSVSTLLIVASRAVDCAIGKLILERPLGKSNVDILPDTLRSTGCPTNTTFGSRLSILLVYTHAEKQT